MKIEKFTELDCWRKAREVVEFVYALTQQKPFSNDYGLRDQMQRSAVSIMANIAEGFGTFSNQEFIRFLSYSIRSAFEVQSHLYVGLDVGYVDQEAFEKMDKLASDCIHLCKGLIRYLKENTEASS